MPEGLVMRVPTEQTQDQAWMIGRIIVEGLDKLNLTGARCLRMSDATRAAVVEYLNLLNHSRMRSQDLKAVGYSKETQTPIVLNNQLEFGMVMEER